MEGRTEDWMYNGFVHQKPSELVWQNLSGLKWSPPTRSVLRELTIILLQSTSESVWKVPGISVQAAESVWQLQGDAEEEGEET